MATVKSAHEELKWIEDNSENVRPKFDDSAPLFKDKKQLLYKKLTGNMLVPLGLIATTTCLVFGLVSMNRGDSQRQQFFMRGRVGFQLFTFVTMVATVAMTGRKRHTKGE